MKRRKYIIGIILILCSLITVLTMQFSLAYGETNPSQQNIANSIMEGLIQKGIPIKSVKIIPETALNPPTIIDFVIQSQSEGDKTVPGEIIYLNLIGRAVNLSNSQGLNVGGIGCSIVNIHGNTICRVVDPIRINEQLLLDFNTPLVLDDDAVSKLVVSRSTYSSLSLANSKITKEENGLRGITFEYLVTNIETANIELTEFINSLRNNVLELNLNQKTQIASYRLSLNCTSGEPLMIYINDLLMSRETWWQSEALTCELNHQTPPMR